MLVSSRIFNEIDSIIDRMYTTFAYRLTGAEFLTDAQKTQVEALGIIVGDMPLIELLYLLVRQRDLPGYKKDKALNELLEEISRTGVLPSTNRASQYTIEHAKQRTVEAVNQSAELFKRAVKDEILKANSNFKEQQIIQPVLPVNEERARVEESSNKLLDTLKSAAFIGTVVYTFRREFTDMMTTLIDSATIDSMKTPIPGIRNQEVGDPLVYKQVVNDDRLSPECKRLHTHEDGTPRIYKLSELIANGSNDGKPRSAWRAVIGGTHPNCRCTLRPAKDLPDFKS